jgi:hypothetical protein
MKQTLKQVFDNAKFVKFHPEFDSRLAVWNGGHTVNFYTLHYVEGNKVELEEYTCINVGSFENNEATLEEVKDGIETQFNTEEF